MGDLVEAVESAVAWVEDTGSGHAKALAALACELARDIVGPPLDDGPAESLKELLAKKATNAPPTAALAKELRATLEDLEGLRDGDTAGADLGAQMSTPVFHTPQSGPADAGAERGQGGKVAAPALHAVAGVGGGRRPRGRA